MATARITRNQYGALVEAYREQPGNANHASQRANVHYRTAKRAWEKGWERPDWALPIKELFAQEEVGARARIGTLETEAKLQQAERAARLRAEKSKARIDAAEERAREAQGVRAALNTSLMLLGNMGQFQRASVEVCRQAAKDLIAEVQAGTLHWREALKVLSQLSLIGKRVTEQFETSMEALRKHLGEPEKLVGFVGEMPHTQVDGNAALNALGSEARLKKAIIDVASGVDSPEAEALIEWQVDAGSKLAQQVH